MSNTKSNNLTNSFFSVSIIAYILGVIALIISVLNKISWESVTAFSIGFVTLSIVFVVVLKYLHEQALTSIGEEKSTEQKQLEKEVLENRKTLETERLKNERVDYIIKTAVEMAKLTLSKDTSTSESNAESKEKQKSKLSEKVEEITTLVSKLDGDYKNSIGSLVDLNEQIKFLSKALESVMKGSATITDNLKGQSQNPPN